MLEDVPCLAQTREVLRLHKAFGNNIQFIYNYMLQAESPYEFAGCLIALRKLTGDLGYRASGEQRNALITRAIELTDTHYDAVIENLHRGYEKKVSTETYNEPRVTTNMDNVIQLSDAARSDQRLWNEERGSNYIGPRMVRARVNHVNGYYWTGGNQNIENFKR